MIPVKPQAVKLFHEGTLALAKMEHVGIRVDMKYLTETIDEVRGEQRMIEEAIRETKVWKVWEKSFGKSASLMKDDQLRTVLFKKMGYKPKGETQSGLAAVDEKALSYINEPFVKEFSEWKHHKKILEYLYAIRREQCDGYLHPSYNLAGGSETDKGGPQSYRSSCQMTNFQNYPIRNPIMSGYIRPAFIAQDDNSCIVENDFGQLEVRVAQAYHFDPTMKKYLCDPTKDMHRDTAMDLFLLKEDQVSHVARDFAKNRFVFPQFYGSVYTDCAESIWDALKATPHARLRQNGEDPKKASGIHIGLHLKRKGITKRGSIDIDESPEQGTFSNRVKEVQDDFWNVRFPVYTKWKKEWFAEYQKKGYFWMHTGFRCVGKYRRNQVINYPVQGAAFHCLLWSIIEITRLLEKYRMKSRLIGQIHDSLLANVVKKELKTYVKMSQEVMKERLPKAFKWINIPLEVDTEVAPFGGSWHEKAKFKL